MRSRVPVVLCLGSMLAWPQQPASDTVTVATLVGRLNLQNYKATLKGLTQFGDRRQGTDRNRAAVDWIEAQLKSYGCTNTERILYTHEQPAQDSGRLRGTPAPISVNNDPLKQPDEKLRELNSQPSASGPREEVYCTKVGKTHPDEMYILGAHMDGMGWGEAANDDGSGTALVMELARVFSDPAVQTERSIRFALWNNEESGMNGAAAYVAQRKDLQGRESPAGSGKYPEPKWLGMIQHDMLLFDHGMPRRDGSVSKEQRAEADLNIEYLASSKFGDAPMLLAAKFQAANEKYATDYPANIGPHMSNTDSMMFEYWVPAISVRENERLAQIGYGWDPHWHQPTDRFSTYNDDDFRLGLNAAQTTLGAVGQLAGASIAPLPAKSR